MNGKIFKELFIIILLFIVVVFTLGMLFFDSINVDVKKMESVAKKETTDLDKIINEIDLNSGNNEKVNVTKSVSREDLEKYRQEHSYDTGKKNPFSGVSDVKENIKDENIEKEGSSKENNNDNNIPKNVNDITNNVENKNTSTKKEETTGRFFENKTSK